MQIFPYLLARIGGDSYDLFDYNNSIKALILNIIELDQQIDYRKTTLSEYLLEHIKGLVDGKQQNFLQNIRRNIYNERKIKIEALESAYSTLPLHLSTATSDFMQVWNEREEIKSELVKSHQETQLNIRKKLKQLAKLESLQNGLIFSSLSFLQRLEQWSNEEKNTKKNSQTERALLKYLSRLFAKTSPFSSFTNLSLGEIQDQSKKVHLNGDYSSTAPTGHLRINNFVFLLLKKKIAGDISIFRKFCVRINPTLQKGKKYFRFLINRNNIELFQKLDRSQVLDFIYEELQAGFKTLSELTIELSELTDSSLEELEDYLQKLISVGFIEIHINISGLQPDWDLKILSLLNELKIDKQKTEPILNIINGLDNYRKIYATLHVPERVKLLTKIFIEIEEYFVDKNNPDPSLKDRKENFKDHNSNQENNQKHSKLGLRQELIFFEDTVRKTDLTIDTSSIYKLIESLNDLLQSLPFLDASIHETERMKIYFRSKYTRKDQVPLLKFYEDYYRDFKLMDEKFSERKSSQEKFNDANKVESRRYYKYLSIMNADEKRKNMLRAFHLWKLALAHKVSSTQFSDILNLSKPLIQNSFDGLTLSAPSKFKKASCFGAFIQFFSHQGHLNGVINSSGPGYGRMLGRFLHLFNPKVTELLSTWNRRKESDYTLVEATDASVFNANIHPPLLEHEIWMPNSNNSLPPNKQISVKDLVIFNNNETDELELRNGKTGKQIFVLDLGFQGEQGRSKLYQLLVKFTPAPIYGTQNFVVVIHELLRKKFITSDEKITIMPRIVFENHLILARKRWEIQTSHLPKRVGDIEAEYFIKVNKWRLSLKIPDEVFISINPHRKQGFNKSKLSKDDYKPQYINFLWPQFIDLFSSLVEKNPEMVWIEEMLPDSSQLLKLNGQRYVSEHVVNWYN